MTGNALIEASSGNIGIYRGIPIAYGQRSPELPRSRQRENQGRSLDSQKKPQENSYRIFYSLKYIPYTHSTCRIYSLLVPGMLESRMSQETGQRLRSRLTFARPKRISNHFVPHWRHSRQYLWRYHETDFRCLANPRNRMATSSLPAVRRNGVSADQNHRSASHQDARWPALEACAPIFDRDLTSVRDSGLKAACALRGGYWSAPSGAGVRLDARAEVALGL